MKLYPLLNNRYHVMYNSRTETIIMDDDCNVVCYGNPNVCNRFITKYFDKGWDIYYYDHLKSDTDIQYSMRARYEGIPTIEAQKDKQTQSSDGPKVSDKKPS